MDRERTTANQPNGAAFTFADLNQIFVAIKRLQADARGPSKIIVTTAATEIIPGEYNFKPSPHRSARLHKKLVKRFGSYEKRKPATLRVGDTIYCHPAHYRSLLAQCEPMMRESSPVAGLSFATMMGVRVYGGS